MTNYQHEVREFIFKNFLYGQEDERLSNSASLLALGIIDSTGVIELVSFLEQRYQIKIRDEELMPENLDSIDRLVRFITHKIEVPA